MESHVDLVSKFSSFRFPRWGKEGSNQSHVEEFQKLYFPSSSKSLQFERDFPVVATAEFMDSHWYLIIGIAVAYLGIVFGLQEVMKRREPLNLKWSLCVWNWIVGLASLGGFLRSFPELWKFVGRPYGLYESVCIPNLTDTIAVVGIMFALSKIPELVDTVFVVLKKKPLAAVQWYHHVATMIGSWISAPYFEPATRYVIVINFGVHSLMYPYFALKAIGVKVPRGVAKFITTCQFLQMIVVFAVNGISAFYYLSGTRYCHRHPVSLVYMLIVNGIFIGMFGNLFAKLVLKPSSSSSSAPQASAKKSN